MSPNPDCTCYDDSCPVCRERQLLYLAAWADDFDTEKDDDYEE
jgi:hypothetical protein